MFVFIQKSKNYLHSKKIYLHSIKTFLLSKNLYQKTFILNKNILVYKKNCFHPSFFSFEKYIFIQSKKRIVQ